MDALYSQVGNNCWKDHCCIFIVQGEKYSNDPAEKKRLSLTAWGKCCISDNFSMAASSGMCFIIFIYYIDNIRFFDDDIGLAQINLKQAVKEMDTCRKRLEANSVFESITNACTMNFELVEDVVKQPIRPILTQYINVWMVKERTSTVSTFIYWYNYLFSVKVTVKYPKSTHRMAVLEYKMHLCRYVGINDFQTRTTRCVWT